MGDYCLKCDGFSEDLLGGLCRNCRGQFLDWRLDFDMLWGVGWAAGSLPVLGSNPRTPRPNIIEGHIYGRLPNKSGGRVSAT